MKQKGFTLIELLVVIGILAVLATLVVLVLNPAQLFAQARDAQRVSDFATLQRAINFTLSTATLSSMAAGPLTTVATSTGCGWTSCTMTTTDVYTVDGTGWVGINFTLAAGGSPLTKLPADPTNAGSYHYEYKSNGDVSNPIYEIAARLESDKYQAMMADDGGSKNTCSTYIEAACWYEAGNDNANTL